MRRIWAVFAAGVAFALLGGAGPAPRATAVGDFDGDGKPDRAELRVAPVGYELALILGARPYSVVVVDRGPPQLAGDTLQTTAPGHFIGSAAAPPKLAPEPIDTLYEGVGFTSKLGLRRMIYWNGSNYRAVWLKS